MADQQNLNLGVRIRISDENAAENIRLINNELGQLGQRAGQSNQQFNQMLGGLNGLNSQLRNLAVTAAAAFSITSIANYADTWLNLEGRLKLVTSSSEELKSVQDALFEVASDSRSSLEGSIDLYQRIARNQKELNMTTQEMIGLTDTINKSMIISGGSATSAALALVQFGQAIQGNILNGEEYRSVAEQAPRLLRAIAEGWQNADGTIGVSSAKLRQLALDQQLTMQDKVLPAIQRSTKLIQYEFNQMPLTIGQALDKAESYLLRFIGTEGEAKGATLAVAESIIFLGENIETIAATIVTGAGLWLTYSASLASVNFVNYIGGLVQAQRVLSAHTQALALNNAMTAASVAETAATTALAAETSAREAATAAAYRAGLAESELNVLAAQGRPIRAGLLATETELALATSAAAAADAERAAAQVLVNQKTAERNAIDTAATTARARLTAATVAEARAEAELAAINSSATATAAERLAAQETLNASLYRSGLAEAELNLLMAQGRPIRAALLASETALATATNEASAATARLTAAEQARAVVEAELATIDQTLAATSAEVTIATEAETAAMAQLAVAEEAAALASANLTAAQAALTAEQRALALSTTFTARAFSFLKNAVVGIGAELATLGGALLANPIALTVTAITAATAALYLYRNEMVKVGDSTATVGDFAQAAWHGISDAFNNAMDGIKKTFPNTIKFLEDTWQGFGKFITDSLEVLGGMMNSVSRWLGIDSLVNQWGALAENIRKTREETERLEREKDAAFKLGLLPPEADNLKLNKQAEDLVRQYTDAIKKATLSERDLGLDEIRKTGMMGKEQEYLISLLDKRIAAEKNHGATASQEQKKYIDGLKQQSKVSEEVSQERIKQFGRETAATLAALDAQEKQLSFDYSQGNVGLQKFLDEKSSLIKQANAAQLSELDRQQAEMQASLNNFKTGHKFSFKNLDEKLFESILEDQLKLAENAGLAFDKITQKAQAAYQAQKGALGNENATAELDLQSKLNDLTAKRNVIIADGKTKMAELDRLAITESKAYQQSIAELNSQYAELTGNATQAAVQAHLLATANNELYKKATAAGDNSTLELLAKLDTVSPDLAPLKEKIATYGQLEHQVTRALAAQALEAAGAETNPQIIAFLKARAQALNDVAAAQEILAGKEAAARITSELDYGMTDYIDKLKELRLAQLAGLNPDLVTKYADKLKIEFDLQSPAGQRTHEFFDALRETSTQTFQAMLTQGKSATEALGSFFKNLTDNIAASFQKLGQESLFKWLETGKMPEGGWGNIAAAGLSVGIGLLTNLLKADAPTRSQSTAETYQSQEYGAGAMAIVDSVARDNGFNAATKAAAMYNQAIEAFGNTLQNNISNLLKGASWLGAQIATTQTFQAFSAWMGKVGTGIAEVSSWVTKGFSYLADVYNGAVNAVGNLLGITSSATAAGNAVSGAANAGTAAADSASKLLSSTLAVVGAVYSIYNYVTSIGDILEYGTVGQAIGATLGVVGSTLAAAMMVSAKVAALFGPAGWVVAAVLVVASVLISIFDTVREPILMLESFGKQVQQFEEMVKISFPSGRGKIMQTSELGLISLASRYKGGLDANKLANAAGELIQYMVDTDNVLVAGLNKVEGMVKGNGPTVAYIKNNLDQYLEQKLKNVDINSLVERRYTEIIDLAGESGTKAGVFLNAFYDVMLEKFKATDSKTLAAMGIVNSIAGNLADFMAAVPLSFINLIDEKITGVSQNKTAKEFTDELSKAIVGFTQLKTTLKQFGEVSDETIVGLLRVGGADIASTANNLTRYAIALDTINAAALSVDTVLGSFKSLESALKGLGDEAKTAFYSSFGVVAELFAGTGLAVSRDQLIKFSDDLLGLAKTASEAANNTINYQIAEKKLGGMTRQSAIDTLLKTNAIDQETAANADLILSMQTVTKAQLDAFGYLQTFAVAAGTSFKALGLNTQEGVAMLWEASKNVVAIFGDMQAASDFYTKLSGAFLSDSEQKTAAQRIAQNNADSLLAAANQMGLGATLGIKGDLTAGNVNDFIAKLLQGDKETLNGFFKSLEDTGQGTAAKNLLNAFADLKTTTDALTESVGSMADAAKKVQEYLDGLKTNDALSTLNPYQQFRSTRQDFNTTLASAQSGNVAAANNLPTVADAYLKEARAFYASGTDYQGIFDAVQAALNVFVNPVKTAPQLAPQPVVNTPPVYQAPETYIAKPITTTQAPQATNPPAPVKSQDNKEVERLLTEQNELLKEQLAALRFGFKKMIEAEGEVADNVQGVNDRLFKMERVG